MTDGDDYLIDLFEKGGIKIKDLILRVRKDCGLRYRGDLHDAKRITYKERLAFADWLNEIRVDSFARGHEFNKNKAISYLNRLIFKIDAKIKKLRREGK